MDREARRQHCWQISQSLEALTASWERSLAQAVISSPRVKAAEANWDTALLTPDPEAWTQAGLRYQLAVMLEPQYLALHM